MDTSPLDATIAEVERQPPGRPPLSPVGRLALDVLRLQREALAGLPDAPEPELEVAQGRLVAGNSALGFEDLHVDGAALHGLWDDVVVLFSTDGAVTSGEVEQLLLEAEPPERLLRLAQPWYEHGAYESLQLRSDLTPETLGIALKPWLVAAAARVADEVATVEWHADHCPACGGQPDVLTLRADGRRSLLCSRCDTVWTARPSGCPLCGAEGAEEYHDGRTPGYRLLRCANCGQVLKVVDEARLGSPVAPAAERLFAAELDHLAAELHLST